MILIIAAKIQYFVRISAPLEMIMKKVGTDNYHGKDRRK